MRISLVSALFGVGCGGGEEEATRLPANLIFVAVEEEGAIAVVDGSSGELRRTVDLSEEVHGERIGYDVHNVQVAPDGATAWVTAMPRMQDGGGMGMPMEDQLVALSIPSLEIRARIPLGEDLHVAHVVIAGDEAYVTAFEGESVLVVDLAGASVAREIALPAGTGPHGARLSPDGSTLYVAGMADGSLVAIDVETGEVTRHDLPGRAVQTAVLPDGRAAFATIYDTRQVARLDDATGEIRLFDLPADAAGPIQIYPMPASDSVWVADQGTLDGDAAGHRLYRLDADDGTLLATAEVDPSPHGVVVDEAGARVWTTTLANGTVQSIDVASNAVVTSAAVGDRPNGISCRHGGAAMP